MEHTEGELKLQLNGDDNADYLYADNETFQWFCQFYRVTGQPKTTCPKELARRKANAKELVRRWNSFPEMKERDRIMVDALAEIKAKVEGNPEQPMSVAEIVQACIKELEQAAIKAAKGGE